MAKTASHGGNQYSQVPVFSGVRRGEFGHGVCLQAGPEEHFPKGRGNPGSAEENNTPKRVPSKRESHLHIMLPPY